MTPATTKKSDTVPLICATIGWRGEIRPDDVTALAKYCQLGAGLTTTEAEAVFKLAARQCPAPEEWADFFAETMGGWVVDEWAGRRIDVDKANQLIAWLGGPQARLSPPQFRFLMNVLEKSDDCAEELLSFARASLVRAMGIDVVRVVRAVSGL